MDSTAPRRLFRACGRGTARTLPVRRPLRQRDTMPDFSGLTQYAMVAFASLFILVAPLATAPLFIVMTADDPPAKRRQMARRAASTACLTLTGFALLGD